MATPDPFAGVPEENPGVSGAQPPAPSIKKNPDPFADVPRASTADLGPMGTNPAGNTAFSGITGDITDMLNKAGDAIMSSLKPAPGASTSIPANIAETIALAPGPLPNPLSLFYQPKTVLGQETNASQGMPFTITSAYGKAIADKLYEDNPNHPALAAIASVLPDALLMLMPGGKSGPKVVEPDFASFKFEPLKTEPVDRAGVTVTNEQLAAGQDAYNEGFTAGQKLITDQSKPKASPAPEPTPEIDPEVTAARQKAADEQAILTQAEADFKAAHEKKDVVAAVDASRRISVARNRVQVETNRANVIESLARSKALETRAAAAERKAAETLKDWQGEDAAGSVRGGPDFRRGQLDGIRAAHAEKNGLPPPPRLGPLPHSVAETPSETPIDVKSAIATPKELLVLRAAQLKRQWHQYIPSKNAPGAQEAMDHIAIQIAQAERMHSAIQPVLDDYRGIIANLPADKQLELWDQVQKTGTPPSTFAPAVRNAIIDTRRMLDDWHRTETAAGIPVKYRLNYLPQYFVDTEAAKRYFTDKLVQGGVASFTRERDFDHISDALKAGLKLRSPNLMDAVITRYVEHVKAMIQYQTLSKLVELGLIREGKRIEAIASNPHLIEGGVTRLNADMMTAAKSVAEPLLPGEITFVTADGRSFHAPEAIANLVHVGLFSKSLWTSQGLGGTLFRGWMEGKNTVLPIQFGISTFHLLHEALVLRQAHGSAEALAALIGADDPFSPHSIADFGKGFAMNMSMLGESGPVKVHNIVQAWHGKPVELTSLESTILDGVLKSGFRPMNPLEYRTFAGRNLRRAIQDKRWLSVSLHTLPALMRAIQYPIMDVMVPFFKTQAMVDGIARLYRLNPGLAADEALQVRLFSELNRNVQKRFGEMPYDTLFWDKRVGEAMQATFLSFTWQYGFLDQFGGAALDAARLARRALPGPKAQKAVGSRLAYATLYTTMAMFTGGLITYFVGGREPKKVKDLIYPIVGYNADGTPQRVNTMFFTREYGALYYHYQTQGIPGFGQMALYKANGFFGDIYEQFSNHNYYDQEISNPQAPFTERAMQRSKAFLENHGPISLMSAEESGRTTKKDITLGILGFTPAPGYVERSTLVGKIYMLKGEYDSSVTPYEQVEQSNARRQLRGLFEAGKADEFKQMLVADTIKYGWTDKSLEDFMKSLYEPPAAYDFQTLPESVQVHLLRSEMDEGERLQYLPYASKKAQADYLTGPG